MQTPLPLPPFPYTPYTTPTPSTLLPLLNPTLTPSHIPPFYTMDFKNINTILYKFSSQFKMGNPNIVNSVVLNLDYLLVNFPYFKDIEVVLDFLLSNNKELRFVLRDQVPMILRILKYKKDYQEYEDVCKERGVNSNLGGIGSDSPNLNPYPSSPTPNPYPPIPSPIPSSPHKHSPYKHKRIPYFFNNSNFISKNKVYLWKKSLKGLTLKKFYNSWLNEENDIIFNLNDEKGVYDGVFKILSYHFDLLRDCILIELNYEYLDILLKFIELESAQDLLSKLLDKRLNNNLYYNNLYLILRFLEEMKVCKRLLEIGCYYELEIYIKENDNDFNEIYELRNDLLDKFLKEKSFYKWRSICRILEMMYKVKRDGEIKVIINGGGNEDGEGGSKGEEEGSEEEKDKEGSKEEKDVDYKMQNIANGDIKDLEEKIEDLDINQDKCTHTPTSPTIPTHIPITSPTPSTTPITPLTTTPTTNTPTPITHPLKFKFYIRLLCIPLDFSLPLIFNSNLYLKFINLFLDNPDDSFYSNSLFDFFKISLRNPEYKILLEKGGFIKGIEKIMLRNLSELYGGRPKIEGNFIYCIYLLNELKDNSYYDLVNVIMTGDSLKYNDDLRIDEYLDNFLNDIIIRFTCNLVIDRMPVLSAFLSKEGHPDSKVEFAESKEEKRVRLGGGMQDTL